MIVSDQHVGRFAKLKNYVGPNYQNGYYVLIISYNEHTSEFKIKVLKSPEFLTVKSSQLELITPDEFSTRFPDAPVVNGQSLGRAWPSETVLDFRECEGNIDLPTGDLQVTISGSCRIVGGVFSPGNDSLRTNLALNIQIETASDDDIVEFEHMIFDQSSLGVNQMIVCARGKVVFRNCSIKNSFFGLIAGSNANNNLNVTLENCSFDGQRECAITVNCGRVTLWSCIFENVGVSVCVKEDAFLVCNYCHFWTV